MTTQTIPLSLDEAASVRPHGRSWCRLLLDHFWRWLRALAGFRAYGKNWLRPWIAYGLSPITNKIPGNRIARFHGFNARVNECDLYTFANVFVDYPVEEISRWLQEVDLVIDLGANVGAFSFCLVRLCQMQERKPRIIAVEPDLANVTFLRDQPFAHALEIHHAAVGPVDGTATLVPGVNSVTHHVDFSGSENGQPIRVLSLKSLCQQPALIKMDIEGGEFKLLEGGLPENVRYIVLEWHYPGGPADLIPGNWIQISTDIHGASMWYLQRKPAR